MRIRIVQETFDPQAETAAFAAGRDDAGALVSFVGLCRGTTEGSDVRELRIDQYPGFTEREISRLAADVSRRFDCPDLLVVALATHRANAFEAVRVMMDFLKTDAPLWKKETGPDGVRWIEPRAEDHARRAEAEKGLA